MVHNVVSPSSSAISELSRSSRTPARRGHATIFGALLANGTIRGGMETLSASPTALSPPSERGLSCGFGVRAPPSVDSGTSSHDRARPVSAESYSRSMKGMAPAASHLSRGQVFTVVGGREHHRVIGRVVIGGHASTNGWPEGNWCSWRFGRRMGSGGRVRDAYTKEQKEGKAAGRKYWTTCATFDEKCVESVPKKGSEALTRLMQPHESLRKRKGGVDRWVRQYRTFPCKGTAEQKKNSAPFTRWQEWLQVDLSGRRQLYRSCPMSPIRLGAQGMSVPPLPLESTSVLFGAQN